MGENIKGTFSFYDARQQGDRIACRCVPTRLSDAEKNYLHTVHFATVPDVLKPLAGDFLWRIPTTQREVYLTFDDGPIPEVTPEVLDILQAFNAPASFFCLGKNVEAHPQIFADLSQQGHTIGNHTHSHPNGWNTPTYAYLRDAMQGAERIQSPSFRPPYGRITRQQAAALKTRYTLVMWDVLSGDYLPERSPERCLETLKRYTREGSIIVFHDSLKAARNVLTALPLYLEWLKSEAYICRSLSPSSIPKKA